MTISALARCAPEPRLPRMPFLDDLGPLLPRGDEATFVRASERVDPAAIPGELRALAVQVETMLTHPAIVPDHLPAVIARHLRALAGRIGGEE